MVHGPQAAPGGVGVDSEDVEVVSRLVSGEQQAPAGVKGHGNDGVARVRQKVGNHALAVAPTQVNVTSGNILKKKNIYIYKYICTEGNLVRYIPKTAYMY